MGGASKLDGQPRCPSPDMFLDLRCEVILFSSVALILSARGSANMTL